MGPLLPLTTLLLAAISDGPRDASALSAEDCELLFGEEATYPKESSFLTIARWGTTARLDRKGRRNPGRQAGNPQRRFELHSKGKVGLIRVTDSTDPSLNSMDLDQRFALFRPNEALNALVILRPLFPNWDSFTWTLAKLEMGGIHLPEDDESPEYRAVLQKRFVPPTWLHPGMRRTALERATGKPPILLRSTEDIAAACGYTGPV